jgi:acetate kinase
MCRACSELDPAWRQRRTIIAHLGNGASLCALEQGRSVATTMGFTAVDGLPMGTRTGSLDPGVILYLLRHDGRSVDDVEHLIYAESGLLGVSGVSSDMRTLLASDAPSRMRSSCSRIASRARWPRWPACSAASIRWCSPRASASMRRACAS